jgi:hypothetical protein
MKEQQCEMNLCAEHEQRIGCILQHEESLQSALSAEKHTRDSLGETLLLEKAQAQRALQQCREITGLNEALQSHEVSLERSVSRIEEECRIRTEGLQRAHAEETERFHRERESESRGVLEDRIRTEDLIVKLRMQSGQLREELLGEIESSRTRHSEELDSEKALASAQLESLRLELLDSKESHAKAAYASKTEVIAEARCRFASEIDEIEAQYERNTVALVEGHEQVQAYLIDLEIEESDAARSMAETICRMSGFETEHAQGGKSPAEDCQQALREVISVHAEASEVADLRNIIDSVQEKAEEARQKEAIAAARMANDLEDAQLRALLAIQEHEAECEVAQIKRLSDLSEEHLCRTASLRKTVLHMQSELFHQRISATTRGAQIRALEAAARAEADAVAAIVSEEHARVSALEQEVRTLREAAVLNEHESKCTASVRARAQRVQQRRRTLQKSQRDQHVVGGGETAVRRARIAGLDATVERGQDGLRTLERG